MNLPLWLTIVLIGLTAFFTQSSTTEPIPATPTSTRLSRAEQIETVLQNPDSELEARVLSDGVVTAEEYEEAVDAYLACMADAGYTIQISPAQFVPGVYQYMHDSSATPEAEFDFDHLIGVSDDCSIGTTMNIEAIYSDQIANPDDVDVMVLTVSCLEASGMIKEGELTPEQLKAQLSQQDPDLPFDLWDEQAMSCLVNPAQNGINGNPLILVTPPAESTPAP